MARLRAKEAEAAELRVDKADLEVKGQVLRRDVLETEVVAESYGQMSHLLAEARSRARDELKALLRGLIEVIEWRPKPDDPRQGDALIELFPLPTYWPEGTAVNRPGGGSPSRSSWLRRRVSNPRPGG